MAGRGVCAFTAAGFSVVSIADPGKPPVGGIGASKGSAEGRSRTSWRPRRSDLGAGTEACCSCSDLQFTDAVAAVGFDRNPRPCRGDAGGCVWLLVDNHPGRGTALAFAGLGAVGVFTTVLGALVAWRVPGNPVGVLCPGPAGCSSFFSALDVYYPRDLAASLSDASPIGHARRGPPRRERLVVARRRRPAAALLSRWSASQ